MRFFLKTFGCTLNQADGDAMRALLLADGAGEAESERDADVVVLNTCAVKRATEQKIAERIKRVAASGKPLVVAGCLPASNRQLVEKIAPRASVIGPGAVLRISEAARAARAGERAVFLEWNGKESAPFVPQSPVARIPISEGCLSSCSFCATKLARPGLRSYSPQRIVERLRACAAAGALEVQLTAQDVGAYGRDRGTNLEKLMEEIASAFASTSFRVRLGMINPEHALALPRLPSLLAAEPFYHFLHLPVQSGSDVVLKVMKRRYTASDFEEVVARFRKEIPDITIATDVICGHPGESDEEFAATLALLERARPDVVNVSRFSARPGTRAARMPQLPPSTINERTKRASELARKISLEKNLAWVGKTVECVVLERARTPVARTRAYKHVALEEGSMGDRVLAVITGVSSSCLKGKVKQRL
ncbi:MAG: tRNA (N(6)-L-threonylcarbamoyladenosine(37)-C(2))-methylthiotransferase [Candidatus Micrarchaeia archaeon]